MMQSQSSAGRITSWQPLDLDSIRQRNEDRKRIKAAATAGPWDNVHLSRVNAGPAHCGPASAPVLWSHWENMDGNILFAAHARNDPVEADVDALLAEVERLREALKSAISVAYEAYGAWQCDQDHRVGKILKALTGEGEGYRADIDAIHAALTHPSPSAAPE